MNALINPYSPTLLTMATSNLNSTLISLHLLLLSLFILYLSATSSSSQLMSSNPVQDIACTVINCGQGTCTASNASTSLLGFDCECFSGWKKMQIGPLTFPSCVVPNCTLDFQCGNGSPPSPPPPPPLLPPPLNLTNPCGLIWCGDGNCVTNGTGHTCQCFDGSSNLFGNSELACFKNCYLGADCNGLGLNPPPPPPTKSNSPPNGPTQEPNCSRKLRALTMILLAATTLTWF